MTVMERLDHWTDLHLEEQVRQPLIEEMHEASRQALVETDPLRRAFFTGLFTGYAVAFGLVTREALERARRTPFSTNLHVDFWRPSSFADDDTYWATGVRHGYYLGTSERPDADECVLDGERICRDLDDHDSCMDGVFCAMERCSADWHANGGSICKMEGPE